MTDREKLLAMARGLRAGQAIDQNAPVTGGKALALGDRRAGGDR